MSFRLPKKDYANYQAHIKELEVCQVCDISHDLDTPHHTEQGALKDDRTLINICIRCHYVLHTIGYSTLSKTRVELRAVGKQNWQNYIGVDFET